ncbi:MAG: SpoVR family protein [Vulcanibacillus sp.]
MNNNSELSNAIIEITDIAINLGLDPFPMRYEICPSDIIYTFGVYGMPTRYSHWSFGKAFYKLKLQYDLGLTKIYELIINSNPSYAFLLEGNSLIQNKLIVAHVLAHSDFFKNNIHFANTSRDMVESMARTAERIRVYETNYGKKRVEEFIDSVIAIQEHVDPYANKKKTNKVITEYGNHSNKSISSGYDDLSEKDNALKDNNQGKVNTFEKDILLFIWKHSKVLEDWQRDILTKLREEMLYFWPQIETKIMNEGWATYWHTKILREIDLSEEETIELAKLNSTVLNRSGTGINPYYLGLKIFEDLEEKWGRKAGYFERSKIFEVREFENDISFIRNYLTNDLISKLDLFLYQKKGNNWVIVEKNHQNIRNQLINERVNGGYPYIVVIDGDYLNNGELYLKHQYEELELDIYYLEKTLPYIYKLWGRMVHIETTIENRLIRFSYDGKKSYRKFL